MNTRTFEAHAPAYWLAGLPTIPLHPGEKRPAINQWQVYGTCMPSPEEQASWLLDFPTGNIGLPFGSASGLVGLDIDTDDKGVIEAIIDVCGPSPWVRVGKKGMLLVYRFSEERNFKLRGADGMICELLSQGCQAVMPPSIHPDTQRPYTANANLWEVLDQIPCLPDAVEGQLRSVLGSRGVGLASGGRSSPLDVIPAGERDVQMVRHAGYLARVVLGIDRSVTFSLHEAIMQMHTWVEDFTAKVSGDSLDPGKGVAKLLEFLIKDIEGGRTMPRGWDKDLPAEYFDVPTVQRLMELQTEARWTPERAIQYFRDLLEQDSSENGRAEAVKMLIRAVAKDPEFDAAAEVITFHRVLSEVRRDGFDLRQLKSMLRAERSGADPDGPKTHNVIAREVLQELERNGQIRFDNGTFWQWNGSCFAQLDSVDVHVFVAEMVKGEALVRRNSDYKAIVDLIGKISNEPLANSAFRGVNFANGFVGEDLVVVDHDPKFGATFTLPFEYDRDNATRCNRWLEFLASSWGHEPDFEQRVMALQEMFAATLFGIATTYQRAFLLFGKAETGKTQILKVLRAMLPPDAVATLGPQLWGERFQITRLIGAIANICGELPENGMITGNVFKEVVEGSVIPTEFKGKDGFDFAPVCANWFASNYLPVSRDTTRGFTRRWLILDFNHKVRDEDRVENLAELIVAEEREAIAAWALEGLRRLVEQRGYTEPACHVFRSGQMRRINNSVQAFLEDSHGHVPGDGQVKCRDLYDQYVFHMRDVGRSQPVSFERFMQMLEDLELGVVRDVIGDYQVVGLVPAADAGFSKLSLVGRG